MKPGHDWPSDAFEAALSAADAVNALHGGPSLNRVDWSRPMIRSACLAFLSSLDRGAAAERFREQGWVRRAELPIFSASTADFYRPVTTADLNEVLP